MLQSLGYCSMFLDFHSTLSCIQHSQTLIPNVQVLTAVQTEKQLYVLTAQGGCVGDPKPKPVWLTDLFITILQLRKCILAAIILSFIVTVVLQCGKSSARLKCFSVIF